MIGIDTIRFGITTPLPSRTDMRKHGFRFKGGGYFKNVVLENGCSIALQANKYDPERPYLGVTFSPSKLIHGNNVQDVTADDFSFVPDTISDIVTRETRIDFDAHKADIGTVHYAYNFRCDSDAEASAYRDYLRTAAYPYKRLDTSAEEHGTETLYFRNRSVAVCWYLKHLEMVYRTRGRNAIPIDPAVMSESIGMLRWEHRLLTAARVRDIAGQFGCTRRVDSFWPLIPTMARATLVKDMQILGLGQQVEITGERERIERLKIYCGSNTVKLESLLGFLHLCDNIDIDKLVQGEYSKCKTFAKRRRELRQAGIAIGRPTAGRLLRPLALPTPNEGAGDDTLFNKSHICSLESIDTSHGNAVTCH